MESEAQVYDATFIAIAVMLAIAVGCFSRGYLFGKFNGEWKAEREAREARAAELAERPGRKSKE